MAVGYLQRICHQRSSMAFAAEKLIEPFFLMTSTQNNSSYRQQRIFQAAVGQVLASPAQARPRVVVSDDGAVA